MARGKKKESSLTPEEKLAQALVPVEEHSYKVPENWCWIRQNSICSLSDGEKNINELFPYWEVKALRGTKELQYVSAGKFVYQGSKVILVDGENSGEVFDIPADGYMGSTFKALQISPTVHWDYLRFFISTKQELYRNNKKGSAIPHLNKELFFNMPLPLAPISEQQRIVERVEYLFAKLDEAKEKAQSVLDSFETRKAAILHKAFIGELTTKWRAEHGVRLEDWEQTNIGDIADVKGGKRVPKGMELTTEDTGHPYIKAGNLKQGTVIDEGMMYVPDDVLQYIKNYTVQAGDVYITNVGACIGDCGIIPPKYDGANLTENAVKITNLRCNGDYLARFLASNTVQQMIKGLIASATLGKLSIANIKTIEIALPSFEEQAEIVRILDSLFAKEQQAKEAAEAVLEKIDLLKKSILARAFRGELGTNDPTEESAVKLLKEIL